MDHPQSVVGYWKTPSQHLEGKNDFLYFGKDGKYVQFITMDLPNQKMLTMKLYYKHVEGNAYRFRNKPEDEGWPIKIRFEGEVMILDRAEHTFYLYPAQESELPDWFPEKLEKVLQSM